MAHGQCLPWNDRRVPSNCASYNARMNSSPRSRSAPAVQTREVVPAEKGSRRGTRTHPDQRVSPTRPSALSPGERLGLGSDWDYALHLPLHYMDETRISAIASLRDGVPAVVQARIVHAEASAGGRKQLRIQVQDASGVLNLRFFHFYQNWQRQYAPGKLLRVRGEPRAGLFGMEMVHPTCHAVRPDEPLPERLTPVYPTAAGISQVWLRKAITGARARLEVREWLPADLLDRLQLPDIASTLDVLHAPPPDAPLHSLEDRSHPGWQRVKFDELLAQQLAQQRARLARSALRAWSLPARAGPQSLGPRLLQALPFALTLDQEACAAEIASNLARSQPMHRLLQGDVGSGKTVVAALAAAQAIDCGFQCALMAPTDILATQHLRKLADWLEPLGVRVAWLSGAQSRRERDTAVQAAASGAAQLVVGTHAVIQEKVRFHRLGLAIVDEQHRFGVAQRLSLRAKGLDDAPRSEANEAVREPHLLMMSATPIPRTLAMAVFGDLDVSTIAHLPPGRSPIRTRVFDAARRDAVIARVRALVAAGRQVYWVCPLVEESAARPSPMAPVRRSSTDRRKVPFVQTGGEALDLRNAEATHAELQVALGTDAERVGLLHGRMPASQKTQVMADFAAGRLRLLVATTVIEVGVDVPAATLMVIEHAERFGLSQLHQLRGRVGRGADASECLLLFTPPLSEMARARLLAIRDTNDGFALAQKDLELRGPGELLGQRQSGVQMLRHADLHTDVALLEAARDAAVWLLRHDPLAADEHLQRWLGGRLDWLAA